MNPTDIVILKKMIEYCDDITAMIVQFGATESAFLKQKPFQYATAMCVLQIGELVNRLSPETIAITVQIPWRMIRAMRNVFAHCYDKAEREVIWETITEDIPVLRSQLQSILEQCD